jgi:hypothetical protein
LETEKNLILRETDRLTREREGLKAECERSAAEAERSADQAARENADGYVVRAELRSTLGELDRMRAENRTLVASLARAERALAKSREESEASAGETASLERSLAEAYEALHQLRPGLVPGSDPAAAAETLAFPLSDTAIALFERLPAVFGFDTAHEAYRAMERDGVGELLRALIEEGCVAQVGERFEKTGHQPFF